MSTTSRLGSWSKATVLILCFVVAGCEQDHNSSGVLNNSEASSDGGSFTPPAKETPTGSSVTTSGNVGQSSNSLAFATISEFGQIVVITQIPEVTPIYGGTNNIPTVIVTNPIPFFDDSIWSNYWQQLPADQTGDLGDGESGCIMTTPASMREISHTE